MWRSHLKEQWGLLPPSQGPPPAPTDSLGPLSPAESQLVSITPGSTPELLPRLHRWHPQATLAAPDQPECPLSAQGVCQRARALGAEPGKRLPFRARLLEAARGGGAGAGGRGPRPSCGHTRTHMYVHPQACMPVAPWLLMTAAFLPCSAKPWQTGKKKGSVSLQRAEIFHHEVAHLCNKKGKMFKRAFPRNCLTGRVRNPSHFWTTCVAGRPCP